MNQYCFTSADLNCTATSANVASKSISTYITNSWPKIIITGYHMAVFISASISSLR